MEEVIWVVDNYMISHQESDMKIRFLDAFKRSNTPYIFVNYAPFKGIEEQKKLSEIKVDAPVVVYGTFEFCREIQKNYSFIPGVYYTPHNFYISKYIHQFPKNLFLNEDYIIQPFGIFKRNPINHYLALFNCNEIFIKPDTGFKSFAGVKIDTGNEDIEKNTIDNLSSATDDTLCVITEAKKVRKEWRFLISNKKIIDGCQYMENHTPCIKEISNKEKEELEKFVANISENTWQPDINYICDVGLTEFGELKVIELNSFSCSGLYDLDLGKVVEAVSQAALLEFEGEISPIA